MDENLIQSLEENERRTFERRRKERQEMLNHLLDLIESRANPGHLNETIEKVLLSPKNEERVEELARLADSSRLARSSWLWVIGGVTAITGLLSFGWEGAARVRDFLDWLLSHHTVMK